MHPPLSTAQALSLKAHSEEEYRAAFERVDVDGSGFITLDEVADLLRTVLGSEPTDFQVCPWGSLLVQRLEGCVCGGGVWRLGEGLP